VREALRAIDPDLPMYKVRTMEARVAESLATRRFATLLLVAFALVALALASVGIAGVMAYLVTQGQRDLGIRLALGATPRRLVLLVLRHGMAVTLAGLAAGMAGAGLLARAIQELLFDVEPLDPLTYLGAAAVLALVALAACYGPARRASRIDPIVSLRAE
jgi:ABC-type antimicrobial peptide transport system permease subunit